MSIPCSNGKQQGTQETLRKRGPAPPSSQSSSGKRLCVSQTGVGAWEEADVLERVLEDGDLATLAEARDPHVIRNHSRHDVDDVDDDDRQLRGARVAQVESGAEAEGQRRVGR